MRVLVTGWFSFLHGEATAGDVLALEAVRAALVSARVSHDTAWSPVFRPGELRLEQAPPERYTHLIFVCGPLHGKQIEALHARYASCRRIAVGVSVIDPAAPAVTGFDLVLARDGGSFAAERDLATDAQLPGKAPVPVAGVALALGQGEYGGRRRHADVADRLTSWLGTREHAPVPLETRLDSQDWRLCSTAEAFMALVSRLDVLVTTRLHGLVLALRAGVPVLAADPVDGGGKVTAQARALGWPAILSADATADRAQLDVLWEWCLSPAGREAAAAAALTAARPGRHRLITAMLEDLRPHPAPSPEHADGAPGRRGR
jgi:hypothetical protein